MKRYRLKMHCCMELPITLCLPHLEARIKAGWTLLQDNGADNQPCYDCQLVKSKILVDHKSTS